MNFLELKREVLRNTVEEIRNTYKVTHLSNKGKKLKGEELDSLYEIIRKDFLSVSELSERFSNNLMEVERAGVNKSAIADLSRGCYDELEEINTGFVNIAIKNLFSFLMECDECQYLEVMSVFNLVTNSLTLQDMYTFEAATVAKAIAGMLMLNILQSSILLQIIYDTEE